MDPYPPVNPKPHAMCPFLFSQYACGIKAEVVGKPAPGYFQSALQEMGVESHEVGQPLTGVCGSGSVAGGGPGHSGGAALGPEVGLRPWAACGVWLGN